MENSDIKVKSTELHFFFVKIVTVLIFTFTTSSSFNYVFSGSADAPAISNNTLLKTIIFLIFVGEVLSNKYFSDPLDRSFFKLYLFFTLKNDVSSCMACVADHRLNPRYRLFRVPYLGLEWQVGLLRRLTSCTASLFSTRAQGDFFNGVFDHEADKEGKKEYLKKINHTVAVFELAREQQLTQYPFVTNHVWRGFTVSLVVLLWGHKCISLLVEIFSVASCSWKTHIKTIK